MLLNRKTANFGVVNISQQFYADRTRVPTIVSDNTQYNEFVHPNEQPNKEDPREGK